MFKIGIYTKLYSFFTICFVFSSIECSPYRLVWHHVKARGAFLKETKNVEKSQNM